MPSQSVTDWRKHRAVVFESDDWGNCGTCPNMDTLERVRQHPVVAEDDAKRKGVWRADTCDVSHSVTPRIPPWVD